jgi:hypothetical protein
MKKGRRAIWERLKQNPPATTESIEDFCTVAGIRPPEDYVEFLRLSNGATGTLGTDQYITLWPVEKLLDKNKGYGVAKYAPGIFIFGSNGGGEAYGFDLRRNMTIVQVPFVGMELSAVMDMAPTFTQFISALDRSDVS